MPYITKISEDLIQLGINLAIFVTVFTLFMTLLTFFVASYCVYVSTLSRNKKGKWDRKPSSDEPDHLRMDEMGLAWHHANKDCMQPVHIVNDGLNLYGEYYDFASDRCVIILPGRSESLRYSYYFAPPYMENGYNVLVIDPRSHGYSDGIYNTVGFEESKDTLAWAKFLNEKYGITQIVLHGICVGAAAGILAVTDNDCPDYVCGIVTEGMFANFNEIMKTHLIDRKKPTLGMLQLINMWMVRYTNHDMNYGPIDVIGRLEKPILMMHSKKDIFSLPEHAEKMYNMCPVKEKKFVWFEEGGHSMLRITDTELYDTSIKEFLSVNFPREIAC